MKKRDIPAILLLCAGIPLIMLYVSVCLIAPYFLPSVTVPCVIGIIFILIAAFRFIFKNKKFIIFTNVLLILGILIFIITQAMILTNINSDTDEEADYLVVLGCSLYSDVPSDTLKMRLDKALEYASRYPDCKIVVSGGQGDDEAIPESLAMKIYLIKNGISEDRIIQEDKSRNTIQNFKNTKEILDNFHGNEDYSIAFVTSGFHVFRSKMIAKSLGLKTYYGISSPYPKSTAILDHLRETASIIVFFLKSCLTPIGK